MVFVETTFPRGGTVHKKKIDDVGASKEIFGVTAQPTKKANKQTKNNDNATKEPLENVDLLPQLKGNSVRSLGTIVMGYVKDILGTKLVIQLPAGQMAYVFANAISDAYTQQLEKFINGNLNDSEEFKTLGDLYKVGQAVCGKVIDSDINLTLTLNPKEVHCDLIHSRLAKGFSSYVAITSIEEHGYMVDTGIPNLRSFLPLKNVNGLQPVIGELVYCCIEKIESAATESTATLKLVEKTNKAEETGSINLNNLLPCTIVTFTITRILKNSLEGTICKGAFQACVLKNHINPKKMDKYIVGEELTAQIVCIVTFIKVVYVTLNLSSAAGAHKSAKKIGKLIDTAVVTRNTKKAIFLKLDANSQGLVVKYHNAYGSNVQVGQTIRIKVLDYNIFDRMYFCTNDERLLQDNSAYSMDNLQINNQVDFIVKSIKEHGLIGYVGVYGNLKTFMGFNDLSMKNVKKGDIIPTKVMAKDLDLSRIDLSNRQEYFDDAKVKVLLDIDDAEVGRQYTGMVVKDSADYYVIRFFNNVIGLIFKSNLKANLTVGKIMNFEISSIREINGAKRINLSIPTGGFTTNLGTIHNVVIKSMLPNGVQIEVINSKPKQIGFISNLHFSSDLNLSQLICKTYKIGDKIKCVNIGPKMYSVCDLKYYADHAIRSFEELKVSDILRGHVKNIANGEIEVSAPIRNYDKSIFIQKSHIDDDENSFVDLSGLNVHPEQIVYMHVYRKNRNELACSLSLARTWAYNLSDTITIFMEYLNDLKLYKKQIKDKIQIGDKITGQIVQIDPVSHNITVKLLNCNRFASGTINKFNYISSKCNYKVDDEIEATVLWIDYVHSTLDLTLKYENFNTKQEEFANHITNEISVKCSPVLMKNEFVMGYNKEFNQMVFLPKRVHYNDFYEIMGSSFNAPKPRPIILKKYAKSFGMPIGFGTKFYHNFDLDKVREANEMLLSKKRDLDDEEKELINKVKKMKRNQAADDDVSDN